MKIYKKILAVVLCGVILVSVTGCKGGIGKILEKVRPAKEKSVIVSDGEDIDTFETESLEGASTKITLFTIERQGLEVFSGPGYNYEIIDYIEEAGAVTVTNETEISLSNGAATTWAKLSPGKGWINLIDAKNITLDPLLCTGCHKSRQEGYNISRYGFCDDCHQQQLIQRNGRCDICQNGIDDEAHRLFGATRCSNCAKCDICGIFMNNHYSTTKMFRCVDCYISTMPMNYCTSCGQYAVDYGLGKCLKCGIDECVCGGPLTAYHDCNDYPNIICPDCGWGYFSLGVEDEEIYCPDCGVFFVP